LPATGRLAHLGFPAGAEFGIAPVRIDSGVRQGDEVSPWYDPMIAKIIVHGPTRAAALNMLTQALADCHVAGSVTNLEFLGALSRHEGFGAGDVDTGLIARDLASLVAQTLPSAQVLALASLAALGVLEAGEACDPWSALAGWRHWTQASHSATLAFGGVEFNANIVRLGQDSYQFSVADQIFNMTVRARARGRFECGIAGRLSLLDLVHVGATVTVFGSGRSYSFAVPDVLAGAGEVDLGGDNIIAPMPGVVKLVTASAGQLVCKGDALMVLEAMKMEHTLTAPRDGMVSEVLASAGDQVTDGALLLTLEPEDA
jgi:3-methylcrotonyl-CoA carboxylase alpha subunit